MECADGSHDLNAPARCIWDALLAQAACYNGESMTRRKKSSEVYSGLLTEPLPPSFRRRFRRAALPAGALGIYASTSLPAISGKLSHVPQWRIEYDQKLPLLLEHFGIKQGESYPWFKLAVCLAVAHVPGFQEKSRRKGGRKRIMSWEEGAKLDARFCELKNKGHSERSAAAIMAEEIKKAGGPKVSGAALLRRVQRRSEATQKFTALFASSLLLPVVTQNPKP